MLEIVVQIALGGIPQKLIVSSGFAKAIAADVLILTTPPETCDESPLDHATAVLVVPIEVLLKAKVDTVALAALIGVRI